MESPQFCGQVVSHADASPIHRVARRAPRARRMRQLPHRRRSARRSCTRSLPASGSSRTSSPAHSQAGSARCPHASWAQAETCLGCHQPHARPGDRIRVIREYGDDEKNTETVTVLADAHGWPDIRGPLDPLAREPCRPHRVRRDRRRSADDSVRQGDRRQGERQGIRRRRIRQNRRSAGGTRESMDCVDCHNAVGHPISPTPQKAIDRAIASGCGEPPAPVRAARRRPASNGSYPSEDEAIDRNRSRPEGLLRVAWRQRRSAGRRSCRRRASGRLPAQRVPDDEGDLRRATRTTRDTSTRLDACAVTTTSTRPRMARRSAATASSVTSRRSRSSGSGFGLGLGTRRSGFGARENSELRSSASRGPTRAVDGRSIRLIRQSRQSRPKGSYREMD